MSIIQKWNSISLVKRIVCGLIIGAILGLLIPQVKVIGVLGTLFVGALKAVAPILVFFLVIAALACGQEGGGRTMGRVVALYLIGTFAAAVVAVLASSVFFEQPVMATVDRRTRTSISDTIRFFITTPPLL